MPNGRRSNSTATSSCRTTVGHADALTDPDIVSDAELIFVISFEPRAMTEIDIFTDQDPLWMPDPDSLFEDDMLSTSGEFITLKVT